MYFYLVVIRSWSAILLLLLAQASFAADNDPENKSWNDKNLKEVVNYAKVQRSSSLLLIQDDQVLIDVEWEVKAGPAYRGLSHGHDKDGRVIEDVASLQKSIVSILVGVAQSKGLLDIAMPVSSYLKDGWSSDAINSESLITVRHLLTMTAGLPLITRKQENKKTRKQENKK